MNFTIRESSIKLDPNSKRMFRIEVEFNLNGGYKRLLSYVDTGDILSGFDSLIASEVAYLVEVRKKLKAELKKAVRSKAISDNYTNRNRDL